MSSKDSNKDSSIVMFGGTGSLGNALAKVISKAGDSCTVVSRCELRQKQMQKKYPDFQYVIGDVTNKDWAGQIRGKPKYVFNLAALKHVDTGESNVKRCVDINYHGTVNTYEYAHSVGAKYIFSSTDKAVLPINAYGMSKALAEKFLYEKGDVSICRWANVAASRGSVFHAFSKSLVDKKTVYITDKRMTRFWITLDKVADFMWEHRAKACSEKPHIPAMKASKVSDLAASIARNLGIDEYKTVYTGIRPGEKIHEVLHSSHEYCLTSDGCEQFTENELDDLVARVML